MPISTLIHRLPRPVVKPGILFAVGYCDLVFVATPFLLPVIATHYNISFGLASLTGTFQLGGFMLATWIAGRFFHPRERFFVAALLAASIANLICAILPFYGLFVLLRLVSGLAMGLIVWYGWLQAFGDERRMSDVAMAGPLVGVIAAPLVSTLHAAGGPQLLFIVLAAMTLLPLVLGYRSVIQELPRKQSHNRASLPARVLLACLGIFTLGGSSVFVYVVVLGTSNQKISAATVAIAVSFNAAIGIPAARWKKPRKIPGLWMIASATCAFLVASATQQTWLFMVALVVWGFFFWIAIPGVFEVIASRSYYPEERVGDAQAVMAAGRTFGPLIGGILLDVTSATVLGIVGGSLMLISGIGVFTTRKMGTDSWKTR